MLKARADDLLIFGLEELNLERLREGKPIHCSLAPIGLPQFTMLIYYGADEAAVMKIYKEKILGDRVGEDTIIHQVKPN